MPRPRFKKLPQERRDRILEAAAREFAAHGFERATLNHILAGAGISKGAAYYYFDDKADLFATVVQHYWEHLLGHVAIDLDRLTAGTFWNVVGELYRQPVLHSREQPWMFAVVKAAAGLPDGIRSAGVSRSGMFDWIAALFRRGQRLGLVRVDLPDELLFALLFALDGAVDRWIMAHIDAMNDAELDDLLVRLFATLRRVLAPLAPGPGRRAARRRASGSGGQA